MDQETLAFDLFKLTDLASHHISLDTEYYITPFYNVVNIIMNSYIKSIVNVIIILPGLHF